MVMLKRFWFPLLLAGVVLGALAIRLPDLGNRPMHGDEAINTWKADELRETGEFVYDPHEYHGPTLYYASLPAVAAAGGNYGETTEASFRAVTVAFGAGLVGLLWLVRRGLGRAEALCAGVFAAVSPAMVFYSRYYIHETLLVVFTFLAIAAGWRYARGRGIGWALLCGSGLGLMHATKETWVISVAAMVWGVLLMLIWARVVDGEPVRPRRRLRWKALVAVVVVALSVSAVFFSAFGRHGRGPVDSVLTYWNYFKRGTGNTEHVRPWDYYLGMMLWSQPVKGRSPVTSEAMIVGLAAVGGIWSLRRVRGRGTERTSNVQRQSAESISNIELPTSNLEHPTSNLELQTSNPEHPTSNIQRSNVDETLGEDRAHWFVRFLFFYTVAATFFYAVIKYKTPWCMLSFLHGMTLLAGVGAVALVRGMPHWTLKGVVALLLVAGAGQLGWQAYRNSHVYPADYRRNPFVYSQPVSDVLGVGTRIEELAKLHPKGRALEVKVYGTDVWPIPWYLRRFENVGYDAEVPAHADADVIVAAMEQIDKVNTAVQGQYHVEYRGLRPAVVVGVFIRAELWEELVGSRQ